MGKSDELFLHYAIFMVDETPYCLWSDKDPRELTIDFLDKISPEFFVYQADTNLQKMRYKKHQQMAAIAIRTAFSHGLETLFSLLCAAIQAPYCVPGWMLFCKNEQLSNLLKKINNRESINCMFAKDASWENISLAIYETLVLNDKEKEKNIRKQFARLWSRWSSDFTKQEFSREYNSIKHGFRAKIGGNYLAIRQSASPSKGTLLGKSEFGSRYFVYEYIGDSKNHCRLLKNFRNWDPEAMAWGLHLISMSISNIISALKTVNGFPANKIKFTYPTDKNTFAKPWEQTASLGISSFSFKPMIPIEATTQFSNDEIKNLYKEGKVLG